MMHPAALLDQHLSSYLPENIHLKQDDPRTLESLLGLSAESVHPENVSNAATVDRLVDSLPQSLVEARGGVSGGLPPPPPPPPQQVAISSASPQPAQTPILLTASHVLDGQQGLTFTVAPHGVHQHHLVSSGGAVASNAGHGAPAGTQFVAFQSPLGFAPAGFVAIGGGGPASGGAGGSPAAPVAPSSPSPVQSPYHLQTHSPLPTHASSLPRSSPAPPPLTPSPSPSPSSTAIPSVGQAVGSASVSAPASAPTTLHHLRPNTPIQVQLPASAFPLLQILQQGGTSQGGVSGSPFRTNAGPGTPQQHLHPQPPPPPRPKQPQLLPKPASGAPTAVTNSSIAVSSSSTCIASPAVQSVVSTVASTAPAAVGPHGAQLVIGQNHHHHHHHSPAGTLVLNQMIPGLSQSPVIIQQPGGGVQFILRQQQQQQPLVGGATAASAPTGGVLTAPGVVGGAKGVGGGLVLTGAQGQVLIHHPQHQQLQQQSQGRPLGGTAGPGMAVQAGAATGGQVVRFIATTQGPMQLQQIQTPSGPTLIAVPPGQTLAFPQLRGATTGSGSVVPGAMIQGHAQIIQGATVAPTAQTIQTHLMQQQQQQSLVHGGLANQGRTSGPTMLPNHSAVNVVDSVGVVARTRTMGTGMSPMSVISPPPSLSFPPPQPRKKPKKKKKRKGSRDDEEDGEGSTEVEESGEEMCGGVPGKTLNLADIMKSAGIGDDEDLGPFESGVTDGGDDSSLVQAPQTVQTNAMQQHSNGGGGVGASPDICTNTCVPSQADGLGPHPGLNSNHHQHSSPQQSHLLAQLQGSLAVQQGQGHVRFALSEDGRVLFQRDCATAGQSMSSQTPPSVVSSVTPPIQSQSQTILLHQQSVPAPRAHIAPPAPQPVSQLLSTSANTPSGNVMGGGVGGGSTSGGSPSTGSPAPNNHVVLSQLLSHGGSVNNTIGETALPTLPVGTQLGVGTPSNQNLRNQQHALQQPIPQMPHPENQVNSSMQLPPSPQYQKPITPNMHQQQQPVQIHQPSPQPPPPKHSPPPPEQPQTSHQNQPNSPPSPSFQENQNNSNTVNIGGLVLTQQQQALLHQIKMSDLVAAGAASGLGAKSLTEALIQALSAVASNINLGNSPSSPEQKGGSKCSRPGGKSSQGPPTSTQLLLQQLGAAVAAAARKVIPAGAVVEPGMAQDVRRPSPPVARKRRKKTADVSSPTAISGPRLQGGGHIQNDITRAAGRLSHMPNSPRATTPGTGVTQPVNSFSSPVPSSITESKLSSPIVPAPAIPDCSSQNSNSCEPGMSQELRLNQMNTQVPMCQQSPPQLVPISSSASSSPSTTSLSATTTSSLTSDSSKVHPVSSSSGMVMSGQSPVIPRVQTIQLTAQKQQQLREVQSQLQALTNRKGPRTVQENAAIQHLYIQQQRILLTGKIVPTIPGQHAQGVQFSPLSPSSLSPDQLMAGNSSVGSKGGKAPSTCLANLLRQPVSSTQSPTIRYYHQVGNQIIPLAPQQAVTSSAQGGGSRSMEARPSKTNVGPTGRTPSPPSPTTTVQSPSVASPVLNDSVPLSTTGPSSPVNTVVSAQRELYVCVGGNSGAEDEGDSSSVESALNKQMQGGNSLSSEEQPNGSSCAKSPSKISVPSSMPQAPVCLSNTTQTSNSDSSSVMHPLPSSSSVATQNLNSQGTDSPGEDAASQTTDSSVDISSPRNGIKRPALSPVRPTINKVSLIEQQLRTDQAGALNPDVHTPFSGKADACKRLVRYHVLNERVLSARDLDKADEIFEATARHLLDKFSQMTAKYRYLLLMESMKEVRTSELMMIDRMFVAEEQLALERLKEEARLAEEMEKKKTEEESKSEENANGLQEANPNPSASAPQASSETSLKEVRINLHDVLKSEAIKKEPEEGRYTIVRNPTPVVKEEEVRPEEEKPYDEWEAIQKELSVYCGVKREEGNREEHPPNGEPGTRQLPAGEESSCDASRSPGLGGPAPPLDDPGGGNLGENSNLCEDDDINAQVQSAIDSILNLQRAEDEGLGLEDVFDVTLEEEEEEEEQPQRRTVDTGGNRGGISRATCEVEDTDALSKEEVGGGDLALDEAVRSILSS